MKDNWSQDSFILLPADHKFTKLYIEHVHRIDHAGVEVTLAKMQTKYWVPGARRVIRQVKNQCITCRKLEKKVETQIMGELVPERLQASPAFYHTSLDLFGPFIIRDNVKKRTSSKAYGIIFNCMATRAVYLDVVDGYGTQHFLVTFRRFVTDKGLTWTFNKSADAPWQNGCSEALIKSVKRAMVISVGDSKLTSLELQTAFFEVANLLNERPIGYKPGTEPNFGSYLCPNDLLLGRTGIAVPQGPFKSSSPTQRFHMIQSVVASYWRKWQRDYFSTLLIRQKWHVCIPKKSEAW